MSIDAIIVERNEAGYSPTEVYLFDHEEFGGVEGNSVDRAEDALRAYLVASFGEKNIRSIKRSGSAHVFMMHKPAAPAVVVRVPLVVQ